jgi:hypothetical protein
MNHLMDKKYLHVKLTSDMLALILFLGMLALPVASLGLAGFSGSTGVPAPSVAGVQDEKKLDENLIRESSQTTQSSQTLKKTR